MFLVDVVAAVLLIAAFVSGVQRGFVANLSVIVGFALGALAGHALVGWLVPLWPHRGSRAILAAVVVVVLLAVGLVGGALLGRVLRSGVDRTPLRSAERLVGGVATLLVGALVLLFTASAVTLTGSSALAAAVGSSRVVGAIDELTPAPVDAGLAQLRAALFDGTPSGLGDLLASPALVVPAVPLDLADPELIAAAASVARVSGTALACGRSVTGTGFVIAPERIVTNAHVVAGVAAPFVKLPDGSILEGRVVYFDPVADLAVIAVDGLPSAPLALADDLQPGEAAAVQGYPYGGPFTTVDARVLSRSTVAVPDIYGFGEAERDVYALEADVRPGNSGGPLLTGDGTVAGVLFARGDDDAARGYATTDAALRPIVAGAAGLTDTVDTGACAG